MRRQLAAGAMAVAGLLAGCSSSGPASTATTSSSTKTVTVPARSMALTPLGVKVRAILDEATATVAADGNVPVPASASTLQQVQTEVAAELMSTSGQLRALDFPANARADAAGLEARLELLARKYMAPAPQTPAERSDQLLIGVFCSQQAMSDEIAQLTNALLSDLKA